MLFSLISSNFARFLRVRKFSFQKFVNFSTLRKFRFILRDTLPFQLTRAIYFILSQPRRATV